MAYTAINKHTDYFNTVTYQGDGSSQNEITGVGFQPDFTWVKNRDQASTPNLVVDAIRGYGTSGKTLTTNDTASEASNSATSRFVDNGAIADGFTVGNSSYTNGSGTNYVSWNWLAGGTASSNTDGSITSSVSANTTAGFSIVSYTGTGANATVGHGLGVAPNMIINKCRSAAQNWATYHSSLGETKALFLDNSDAATTSSSYFNDTAPTTSVFTVGTSGDTNKSSQTHISYCFAEKKGYSKFGSYTGNGSTDGTFVYTGFKPAWVLLKNTTGDNWTLLDNNRDTYNPESARILTNLDFAEGSSATLDFLSNGFKCLRTDAGENGSGITYIYMAFAENPLVGTNNIPATAR